VSLVSQLVLGYQRIATEINTLRGERALLSTRSDFTGLLAMKDTVPLLDKSDTTDSAGGTTKVGYAEYLNAVVCLKTADQSNSSNTTLADVTDLLFPVEATGLYVFEFNLFVVAAATTTGLVIAVNGPTIGAGRIKYGYVTNPTATSAFSGSANAYDTALVSTGVLSTTVGVLHQVKGVFKAGATAGNLQLRMRSEISGSNATIQQDSHGRIQRVG
jgi:hypothetical protein